MEHTNELPPDQQCTVSSNVFDLFLKKSTCLNMFMMALFNGTSYLKKCGRSNVINSLVKSLGTTRQDQSDSLLPAKRMPMSCIELCVNFFSTTSINQVCS